MVRENKWEHGMETHVGAEANVPKLESIGLGIWSGDKTINVRHNGSTCRSTARRRLTEANRGTSKYPPAKPGALGFEPLKAAWGPLTRPYPSFRKSHCERISGMLRPW